MTDFNQQLTNHTASAFKDCKMLYVTCIDEESMQFPLDNVPCFQLNVHEAHASFLQSMSLRRILLLTNSCKEKLKHQIAPCIIEATSSCDYKYFDPEEGADCVLTLIHECTVLPTFGAMMVAATPPSTRHQHVIGMPALKLELLTSCNCRKTVATAIMYCQDDSLPAQLTNSLQENLTINSEENGQEIITFKLAGCTYIDGAQRHLKMLNRSISRKEDINVTLEPERENPVDKNAILVHFDGNSIGYIPGQWIAAMHTAIKHKTISRLSVDVRKNVFSLYSILTVTSSEKLPKPDKHYVYGQELKL